MKTVVQESLLSRLNRFEGKGYLTAVDRELIDILRTLLENLETSE